MGWIGNIFIFLSAWLIGRKDRRAFLATVVGDGIWTWYAYQLDMDDLAVVSFVFAVMAGWNFWRWGRANRDELALLMKESELNHEGYYLRNDFRLWDDSEQPERYSLVTFGPFYRHFVYGGAREYAVEQAHALVFNK